MGVKTSALQALFSIFFPPSGDYINLTINTNNNVGEITQHQKEQKLLNERRENWPLDSKISKGPLVIATLCSTYLILYAHFFYLAVKLQGKDCWSFWKNEQSLEELQCTPMEDISHSLILAIQKKYINLNQAMDFFTPFSVFLTDIEKETKYLKQYQLLAKVCDTLHIMYFFPINHLLLSETPKRLERLVFLKNIFITWAASYKLFHHRPGLFINDGQHCSIQATKK